MKLSLSSTHKGFVTLFAILIATVVLLLTIGATNIAYKETLLSSSARESERAFFSADTGIECALYLDRVSGIFVPTFSGGDCGDVPLEDVDSDGISVYLFRIDNGNNSCADVTVRKHVSIEGTLNTEIVSLGYNTNCDNVAAGEFDKAVERRLEATYPEAVAPPVVPPPGGGAAV